MQKLLSLTYLNFKEGIRERVFIGVLFLLFFLLMVSLFLGELSLKENGRIIINAGLSAIELCGLIIAVFLLVNNFYRDTNTKMLDVFLVYASRPVVIMAKFFGFSLTIALFLALSFLGLGIILALFKSFSIVLFWAFYYALFKLLIVIGFTLICCVSFRSIFISLFTSLSLFMTCELLPNAVEFSRVYFSGWRLRMLEILYYLLPNMDKMNIKLMASYGLSPEFGVTASTTLYCLLYLLALLCLAIFIFEKREY